MVRRVLAAAIASRAAGCLHDTLEACAGSSGTAQHPV
jgi:hypothetical protein